MSASPEYERQPKEITHKDGEEEEVNYDSQFDKREAKELQQIRS
jgi:hypothetical protein